MKNEKEVIQSNKNGKNGQDKCVLKSVRMSLFGENKILSYLFHYPDRKVDRNEFGYKDVGIVFAKIIFFVSIVPFFILLSSSLISNTLFLDGESIGYLEDVPFIEFIFLMGLISFFFYLFSERFRKFFVDTLPIIDFSSIEQDEYLSYIDEKSKLFNGVGKYSFYKLILYIIITIGIIWWVFGYAWLDISFPYDGWRFFPSHPLNYIICSSYYIFLFGVIIAPLVWRLLASAYILNTFCRYFEIHIKLIPLHPDGMSGLKSLGYVVFSFHLVILLPIIHSIFSLYFWEMGDKGGKGLELSFLYFAVLILIFFMPLIPSHNVMARHKYKELDKISERYNELVAELKSFSDEEDSNLDKELKIMDIMDKIRNYYKDIEKISVWPFDLTLISGFLTSLLVPLFLMLIQIYILLRFT
jgi:hypothetical protein